MTARETSFIAALRAIAENPAARGLNDDAAVLPFGDDHLVITHDMLVEGVHFLADDAAADVAWKLVAVNMSDLAAKGATPVGIIIGYALAGANARDCAWDVDFVAGLETAAAHFAAPLLGGDTVALPSGAPRTLGLTALGRASPGGTPSRSGAQPGDTVWVSGCIGDAGLGLAIRQGASADGLADADRTALLSAYARPLPDLPLGQMLAPLVTAIADVSDGLLLDAHRIAAASDCAIRLSLDCVPLSDGYVAARGSAADAVIAAATAGDDYVLLFTAPAGRDAAIRAAAVQHRCRLSKIGRCHVGTGLALDYRGTAVPLPHSLGWLHD